MTFMIVATGLLSPHEMGERLIERRRMLDLEELMWAKQAAEFAATDEFERDGFVHPIDWIRINCHMTIPQATDRLAVGERIDEMPESVDALLAGEIGFAHLVVMSKTAEALKDARCPTPFEEGMLLEQAKENTAGKLHYISRHLRHALDAQAYAEEEAVVAENRSLKISSGGEGMVSVNGYLDSAGAAVLRKALEPLAKKGGREDKRKREQRLADALVELATGAKPAQLQVTTSLETLMGLAGAPAAEMEFSLPISAKIVERMACDCSLVRVLLGADSSVIDVGRSTRKISPGLRRALNARDSGCRWPGCDRPAYWSTPHHLVHWIRGGPTELDNLALVCYRHHRLVHEGKWQLVKCDDGRLLTIPPGTRFKPCARGPD